MALAITDQTRTDREDIIELYTRLAAAIDTLDYEAWGDLLTEDVTVDWVHWAATGRASCVAEFPKKNNEHIASQRMVTNHRVRVDGDRATAVALYRSAHLDAAHQPHSHEGWYMSELVRTAEGWRFRMLRRVDLKHVMLDDPQGRALATEIFRHA